MHLFHDQYHYNRYSSAKTSDGAEHLANYKQGLLGDTGHLREATTMPNPRCHTRCKTSNKIPKQTHPSEGVLGLPWMANMGATCSWGVEAAPKPATLCSISPKMQPKDHRSMALVYPPLDSTTCQPQCTDMHQYIGCSVLAF